MRSFKKQGTRTSRS